jgi:hypothetical protein
MYGKASGTMTEETPFNPCRKKGEVRAKISTSLINEWKAGALTAMIARAADFYGPKHPMANRKRVHRHGRKGAQRETRKSERQQV